MDSNASWSQLGNQDSKRLVEARWPGRRRRRNSTTTTTTTTTHQTAFDSAQSVTVSSLDCTTAFPRRYWETAAIVNIGKRDHPRARKPKSPRSSPKHVRYHDLRLRFHCVIGHRRLAELTHRRAGSASTSGRMPLPTGPTPCNSKYERRERGDSLVGRGSPPPTQPCSNPFASLTLLLTIHSLNTSSKCDGFSASASVIQDE